MLVLGRKEGESILIGDRIRLVVSEVKGNRVKIAIDAPEWITIRRDEVVAKQAKEVTQ